MTATEAALRPPARGRRLAACGGGRGGRNCRGGTTLVLDVRAGPAIYQQSTSGSPGGRLPGAAQLLIASPPKAGWKGFDRRIDAAMLAAAAVAPEMDPDVYVCGPTPMVEAVANALVGLGHEPARIRTERFGPTGEG